MLVCALGEGGGLCSERSTAALRWRPRAVLGGVARQGRLQREATGGGGGAARRVGASAKQEVAGWLSTAPAGGALHSCGENRAKELEGGEKDPNIISEISRDQTIK